MDKAAGRRGCSDLVLGDDAQRDAAHVGHAVRFTACLLAVNADRNDPAGGEGQRSFVKCGIDLGHQAFYFFLTVEGAPDGEVEQPDVAATVEWIVIADDFGINLDVGHGLIQRRTIKDGA